MKSLLLMALVAAGTAMADPSVVISGTNFVDDAITSVDLTISGLVTGETNQLWVTYGPAAAGEEPADWQVCAYVQDVTNEFATLNLAMPEGWNVTAKAIRFYLVPKNPLYDFQYEYMDSSGSQYLNTLCTHAANVRLKTKFAVLSNPVGSYNTPFGSRSTGSAYKGALVFFSRYGGASEARFGRGDGNSENADTGNPLPFDTPVELGVEGTSLTWSGGGKTRTFSSKGSATAGFAPMFLFSLNETATEGGATVNAACTMKMRLYSFRMDDDDTPQCEIVPVIKDNELMGYDRVSKTLLPNAGTGAFTAIGARRLIDRRDVTTATDVLVIPEERAIVIVGTNLVDGVVTSLDLSFSAATPGDTRKSALYVTYGRCPGGEGTDGWDQCVRVAEIKPDVNSYTYVVPAGWGKDVRAIRFLLAAVPVEYDSAISYLESTGREWINTEVTHTMTTTIDCELELMSNPVGDYNTPFGSRRNSYSQGYYLFTRYGGKQKPGFCFGKVESLGNVGTLPSNVPLVFRLAGDRDCRWSLHASHEALGRLSTDDASVKNGFAPMLLFTMNETDTEGAVSPNTACNTKMRLRSFKMVDGQYSYSRKMCDLIPVRKGTVGYLYDRVTKRLLANGSGVGAFVCGPDCYGGEHLRSFSATFAWHAPAMKASTARYKSRVTLKGHPGKEPIARFPALLRLSPSRISGFSYDQCESDGADIRIYDLQGELLPHEIDTWNPSGESLVWVRLPALPPEGSAVHLRWGRTPRMPAARPSTEVWSDYLGVWHFNEDSGTAYDSGPFAMHAEPIGYAVNSVATNVITLGRSRYVPGGWFETQACRNVLIGSSIAFSGWFHMTAYENGQSPLLFSNKAVYSDPVGCYLAVQERCYQYSLNSGGATAMMANDLKASESTLRSLMSDWRYLEGAFAERISRLSVNWGADMYVLAENERRLPLESVETLKLLCDTYGTYTGFVDEMRVRLGSTSKDRAAADLMTMADPSFAVFSPAEHLARTGAVIVIR